MGQPPGLGLCTGTKSKSFLFLAVQQVQWNFKDGYSKGTPDGCMIYGIAKNIISTKFRMVRTRHSSPAPCPGNAPGSSLAHEQLGSTFVANVWNQLVPKPL
jgi:hypothetical protein